MRTARFLQDKVTRLRAGLARGGLEYLVTAVASYLPSWLLAYRHHELVRCVDGERGRREEARRRVRTADAGDAERLVGQGELTIEEIRADFERGDACVVVEEGDDVLASAWASTGAQYLAALGVAFEVPEGAFYIHDTFTQPWARRRGLATLCYERLFDVHAAEGRTTAYAAIEMLNRTSRDAHATWGFVPVGRCLTVDAGPLRLILRPRWPLRRPRFQIELRRPRGASGAEGGARGGDSTGKLPWVRPGLPATS